MPCIARRLPDKVAFSQLGGAEDGEAGEAAATLGWQQIGFILERKLVCGDGSGAQCLIC